MEILNAIKQAASAASYRKKTSIEGEPSPNKPKTRARAGSTAEFVRPKKKKEPALPKTKLEDP